MSEVRKGRKFSEEHRKNISEAKLRRKKELGYINSPEARRNMSEAQKEAQKGDRNSFFGKHHSENTRRELSEANKGQIPWNAGLPKERQPFYGKHFSDETHRKMSEVQRGAKSHSWKGGKIPYRGPDWQSQRRLVRERDNYTCLCGLEENGREHDVHHIVPYRISKDNSQDNLWTLCPLCHRRIEVLTNFEISTAGYG